MYMYVHWKWIIRNKNVCVIIVYVWYNGAVDTIGTGQTVLITDRGVLFSVVVMCAKTAFVMAEIVLIIEVSFLVIEVSLFQSVLIREVPLYTLKVEIFM